MIHRLALRFICALFLSFSIGLIHSQDLHFTLHQMTPLVFNPANTGNFYGSYRLSGLYRDQYRSVIGKAAYSTPTFSVDLPIIKGFGEKDWVGVGMFFYSDKSGTIGLTQSSFKASAAYHLALNKDGSRVLSFAYQTGGTQREVKNADAYKFEDQIISGGSTQEMINPDKQGFLDHVGGLKFTSKFNKTDEWNVGVAVGKIGQPNWSIAGSSYELEPRIHAQFGLSRLMSDKVRFMPNISYQKILKSPQNTLVVQGLIDYLYNEKNNTILKGGLGYRSGAGIGDALQVMLGVEYKAVVVMFGYDVNISRLSTASGGAGGIELAAQYVGRIYKRPKPDPVIFCPRF
ncbi:MAG: PorP/SprF family type IX secretion system membrane protein [Bacteroidota bacterium]|nr:PorP/SprF family type IX secretion system membrane protein [Bacteroidota bacterium]